MRIVLSLCAVFALEISPVAAQALTQPSVTKDPQAITILQQALSVAGGAAAIGAIKDYTGSGTLVFHQSSSQQVNGTVTISGLGPGEFRMDSNLSTGTRSYSISQGRTHRKREDGTVTHLPPSYAVPSSDAFPYITPMFPAGIGFPDQELITVLNSPQLAISYKGLVQLDGRSVHDIQVSRSLTVQGSDPMAEYNVFYFFVDAATFQIVMTQDTLPKDVIHQVRYSDYASLSGLLVPLSISEQLGGQRTWEIQLTQISFNSGLQEANCAF